MSQELSDRYEVKMTSAASPAIPTLTVSVPRGPMAVNDLEVTALMADLIAACESVFHARARDRNHHVHLETDS